MFEIFRGEPFAVQDMGTLVRVMQAAIAPATVVSGLAFFLSIVMGRFSRCVDRSRELLRELKLMAENEPMRDRTQKQISILYKRARVLRSTMVLGAASLLGVSLSIMAILADLILQVHLVIFSALAFASGFVFLTGALGLFIRDLLISLRALKLEINAISTRPVRGN